MLQTTLALSFSERQFSINTPEWSCLTDYLSFRGVSSPHKETLGREGTEHQVKSGLKARETKDVIQLSGERISTRMVPVPPLPISVSPLSFTF